MIDRPAKDTISRDFLIFVNLTARHRLQTDLIEEPVKALEKGGHMVDFSDLAWLVAIVVVALFVVGCTYKLIEPVLRKRLLRCPNTGCVAFVEAERVFRGDGTTPELIVRACELWPDRKDCARGCLARYDEAVAGYRVKLEALRPFEQ